LVADEKFPSSVRLRLPIKTQLREARHFAQRGLLIEEIEQEVEQILDSILLERQSVIFTGGIGAEQCEWQSQAQPNGGGYQFSPECL